MIFVISQWYGYLEYVQKPDCKHDAWYHEVHGIDLLRFISSPSHIEYPQIRWTQFRHSAQLLCGVFNIGGVRLWPTED